MKISGYEIIEKLNEFPFNKLEHGFISNGKRGKSLLYYYKPIVTLDTETCVVNGIAFITDISITIEGLATYYCHTIDEMFNFLDILQNHFVDTSDKRMIIYVHNLSYDYVFLRNKLIDKYGFPLNSLAVKTHKYVSMDFGFYEFRDSLILTQKSLAKLTKDENVQVQKAVGFWDYNKIRSPHSYRTDNEKFYVNVDTISLCLALRSVMDSRNVNTGTCPLTSTGFIRNEARKRSRIKTVDNRTWRDTFKKLVLTFEEYNLLEKVFHGGYTHANRYYIGETLTMLKSFDFSSSYPAVLLYEKFPMSKFKEGTFSVEEILENSDDYAFFGTLKMFYIKIKDDKPMPPIAYAKVIDRGGKIVKDNGRILEAEYIEIPFSDPDLDVYLNCYDYMEMIPCNLHYAKKDYLPKWFKDFVQELYYNKCTLKNVDATNYAISKTYINAMYGMLAQKIMRLVVEEKFEDCDWHSEYQTEEDFQKYYSNRNSFLPYQWAVWVTAYAQHNLFELGANCENWIYSDTDSCKGFDWDLDGVKRYNQKVKEKAVKSGYGIVNYNGKEFIIGVAEDETEDEIIEEFKTLGCKRYCYRQGGELHLTVAGVPKIAVTELHNDINNFGKGFIFHGYLDNEENYNGNEKKRPEYHINNEINYIEVLGEQVEYGSYIILQYVDYVLDQTTITDEDTGIPVHYLECDSPDMIERRL